MLSRVSEDVAREWLVAAYGDAKAAEVMRVPWELRVQLYPEVLRFGPAGLRVAALLNAVGDPASASLGLQDAAASLRDAVLKQGRYRFRNGGVVAVQYLYDQLSVVTSAKLNALPVHTVQVATIISALALNAPWLPVLAEEFTRFEVLVDEFFAVLELPVLRVNEWWVV